MRMNAGLFMLLATASMLGGCGRQSTPSMMNTSRPQLINETRLEQVPVEQAGKGYLAGVADNYARYGVDTLQLSLAYDPNSKTYDAMKAFNDLGTIKSTLMSMGVRNVKGDIAKQEGVQPTLMISYDAISAQAPAGCRNMPGFDDGLTTAQVGDYRFGCSVDTMLTKQIYRPSDLAGNAGHDLGDGRRAANIVEYNRQVTQDEAEGDLDRMDRSDIGSQ